MELFGKQGLGNGDGNGIKQHMCGLLGGEPCAGVDGN